MELFVATVLQFAAKWKAVLLLDDATAFVKTRSYCDGQHKNLVPNYQRILEYYDSVLFLNTNVSGSMDNAFKSRVYFSSQYYGSKKNYICHDILSLTLLVHEAQWYQSQPFLVARYRDSGPKPSRLTGYRVDKPRPLQTYRSRSSFSIPYSRSPSTITAGGGDQGQWRYGSTAGSVARSKRAAELTLCTRVLLGSSRQ